MHFNLDVSTLVTWALLIGTSIYKGGQWTAGVAHLKTSLDELKTSFKSHAEDDERRFEELQKTVTRILMVKETG
jgi:hypothetical protein